MSLCCNNKPLCISRACPVISLFCSVIFWVKVTKASGCSSMRCCVLCVSIVSGREHEMGTRCASVQDSERDGALLRFLSVTPRLKAVRTECDASGIDLFRPPPSLSQSTETVLQSINGGVDGLARLVAVRVPVAGTGVKLGWERRGIQCRLFVLVPVQKPVPNTIFTDQSCCCFSPSMIENFTEMAAQVMHACGRVESGWSV